MEYTIAGHTVRFPHTAYGVQLSFMGKALQTLVGKSNALLEAPTGSGKTLSLLCSSLAWQEAVKLELQKERIRQQQEKEAVMAAKAEAMLSTPEGEETQAGLVEIRELGQSDGEEDQEEKNEKAVKKPKENWDPPKIYYATRTHSQIAQVVSELRRTSYRPKMAILASRDHYCVNKTVMQKSNKDEECNNLLGADGEGCPNFKNTASKMYGLQNSLALQVHDIEDLCRVGKQTKSCPYFAARHYAADAELIFSPYNYLIDPIIRNAMDVDVSNAVLIFDEAHNIEDNAREAASADIEHSVLIEAHSACVRMSQLGTRPDLFGPLANRVLQVASWLKGLAEGSLRDQGRGMFEGVWNRAQMMEELGRAGLDGDELASFQKLYADVRAEEEKEREQREVAARANAAPEGGTLKLGGLAHGVISRLLTTLKLMNDAGEDHIGDYRLVIQRWQTSVHSSKAGSRFRRRHGMDEDDTPEWRLQFSLWCMNPAIAFWELNHKAHSIILTSGTLAPLDTFASELGAEFPIRLEAPHVVNMAKQVLVNVISAGPSGKPIQATYKGSNEPTFPGELGQIVLQVCQSVPDGVLVFFPSYSLLDRLITNWQQSGLWREIARLKPAVVEPRGSGPEFDLVMASFYDGIRSNKGGIFFAVCRGKVSEGLDFADGHARAVLVIGIPYPNVKDTKVGLKKKYNDEGSRSRTLLSGDLWYMQQAFRALNQAIGRCLRHRNDYGAILLVDERFCQTRNQTYLSRWVKASIDRPPSFDAVKQNLSRFFARLAIEFGNTESTKAEASYAQIKQESASNCDDVQKKAATAAKPVAKPGQGGMSSEFATISQPTLQNMWRHPGQIAVHKPAMAPGMAASHNAPVLGQSGSTKTPSGGLQVSNAAGSSCEAAQGGASGIQAARSDGVRRLPPSWHYLKRPPAYGWAKPATPSPTQAQPGEVRMTQNRGHGAAGVYGAFASSLPANDGNPSQAIPSCIIGSRAACPKQGGAGPHQPAISPGWPATAPHTPELADFELSTLPAGTVGPHTTQATPVGSLGKTDHHHEAAPTHFLKQTEMVQLGARPIQSSTMDETLQMNKQPPATQNIAQGHNDQILGRQGRSPSVEQNPGQRLFDPQAVRAWLKKDMATFCAALKATPACLNLQQGELRQAAIESIMDSFVAATELGIHQMMTAWTGPLPSGMYLLMGVLAKPSNMPLSGVHAIEIQLMMEQESHTLPLLRTVPLSQSLQELAQAYDFESMKELGNLSASASSQPLMQQIAPGLQCGDKAPDDLPCTSHAVSQSNKGGVVPSANTKGSKDTQTQASARQPLVESAEVSIKEEAHPTKRLKQTPTSTPGSNAGTQKSMLRDRMQGTGMRSPRVVGSMASTPHSDSRMSVTPSPDFVFASMHTTPPPPTQPEIGVIPEERSNGLISAAGGRPDQMPGQCEALENIAAPSHAVQSFYDTSQEESALQSSRSSASEVSQNRAKHNPSMKQQCPNVALSRPSPQLTARRKQELSKPFKPPDILQQKNQDGPRSPEGLDTSLAFNGKENAKPQDVNTLPATNITPGLQKASPSTTAPCEHLPPGGAKTGQPNVVASGGGTAQAKQLLSRNAAAGIAKQQRLAKQAEAKTAKLEGWDTDSDLDAE